MDPQQWQAYIDRQQTTEERKVFIQWLQTQDSAALQDHLLPGWDTAAPPMPAALDQRLHARLDQHRPPSRSRMLYLRWLAAASLLLLGISTYYFAYHNVAVLPIAQAPGPQQLFNQSRQVKLVHLPDGSLAWLSPQSLLEVPVAYGQQDRQLTLKGEAYFEVKTDPTHPFIVNTTSLRTVVLGTHFNMQAYPGEPTISVALSAGKVAVHLRDNTILLSPAHQLIYKLATGQFSTGRFSPGLEQEWKAGALVLDDVPLTLAFHKLEYRFGKKIVFPAGTFAHARFTGTYHQEALHLILDNMAFIHDFRYQTLGDSIFVHPLP